jgi:phosphoglycolate phosphatase
MRTAKNAGMPAIGVSWGYRDRALLLAESPDAIADTPDQLAQILLLNS